MCFSAEASFIVGSVLLVTGAATVQKVAHKKDLPLALIPLIFAAQQLVEGFLWLALTNDSASQSPHYWLSNIYGIFVGIIWPLFAPFAIYCTETSHLRRKIIASIGVAGFALAIYTIIGIAAQPITAEIVHHSIRYEHDVKGHQIVIVLYLLATCVPFIFTSYKHLYVTGFVITGGFFVSYFTFQQTFASVWCFFAAIASSLIYFHFVHRIKDPLLSLPNR